MPRPSDGIEMRDTEYGERPSTADGSNDTSAPTQERGGGRSLRAVATAVVAANRLTDGRPRQDSPLHNPVSADAQPRASTRGSAVMPRPSMRSESGDIEMRQGEPNVDLDSVYADRSSEVSGVNDARAPQRDMAAVAKRTSRTPGSL